MAHKPREFHGVRILECDAAGAPLRNNRELNDLISAAWEHRAHIIVVPGARLDDDFFPLKTGVAGEMVQKIVIYHLRLAIVGDISGYVAKSTALRDFVRESNRGNSSGSSPTSTSSRNAFSPPADISSNDRGGRSARCASTSG